MHCLFTSIGLKVALTLHSRLNRCVLFQITEISRLQRDHGIDEFGHALVYIDNRVDQEGLNCCITTGVNGGCRGQVMHADLVGQ